MVSFFRAKKVLNGKCMRKCYWKFQTAKLVVLVILCKISNGFKMENRDILDKKMHHCCKGKLVLVAIIVAHIFFARNVGK